MPNRSHSGEKFRLHENHLRRILALSLKIIHDEVKKTISLARRFPAIGPLHPAEMYEGHLQSLLFSGFRQAGYYTVAESGYFQIKRRKIDLAVWLANVNRWLFLELERCPTWGGYPNVYWDAKKLIDDAPKDRRDSLRGVLVYGFRNVLKRKRDNFPRKLERVDSDLRKLGFRPVGQQQKTLGIAAFSYVVAGLWIAPLVRSGAGAKAEAFRN